MVVIKDLLVVNASTVVAPEKAELVDVCETRTTVPNEVAYKASVGEVCVACTVVSKLPAYELSSTGAEMYGTSLLDIFGLTVAESIECESSLSEIVL